MLLGSLKNLDLFAIEFLQKVAKHLVVISSSWLISHMYILRSFSEAVDGKILCISTKNLWRSSLKSEQTKRKWISSSTARVFSVLQYGQKRSSLGVLFLLTAFDDFV